MTGVYKIQSKIDNRYYIGSSLNIEKRWVQHKYELRCNRHTNARLQNFVNKYGLDNLVFEVLEECEVDSLLKQEQHYLDQSFKRNFNISLSAGSPMKGRKHSKKTLVKMSTRQSLENNPMFGTRRPQYVIDAMQTARTLTRSRGNEKIKRLVNLPNRKEVSIIKDNWSMRCFSVTHAANIIGVSLHSVNRALNKATTTNGYRVVTDNKKIFTEVNNKLLKMLKIQ